MSETVGGSGVPAVAEVKARPPSSAFDEIATSAVPRSRLTDTSPDTVEFARTNDAASSLVIAPEIVDDPPMLRLEPLVAATAVAAPLIVPPFAVSDASDSSVTPPQLVPAALSCAPPTSWKAPSTSRAALCAKAIVPAFARLTMTSPIVSPAAGTVYGRVVSRSPGAVTVPSSCTVGLVPVAVFPVNSAGSKSAS